MNHYIYDYYIEAGHIAARVRDETLSRIKENVSLLEITEYAEERIREMGAKPAFPCNISINEVASHFTPQDRLQRIYKGDVVKLDIGAHIEGYIADTATTIEIGTNEHGLLIGSCKESLQEAISSVRENIETNYIGKIIEDTIKGYGFNPIKDLTGHSLERYNLHAGINIPNYKSFFSHTLKQDMVFAIEPFATYGSGEIKKGKPFIYALKENAKGERADQIRERFGPLPFTPRWIPEINIKELNGLREYFEMFEKDGNIVAQEEHTIIVHEDWCEILT